MSVKRKRNRKYAAVRMLEQAVREIAHLDDSISTVTAGRKATDLEQSIGNLKRLCEDDPSSLFWDRLQKTVIKVLKRLKTKRR